MATSTLRYWEQLGLLPAPARAGGQRRYPASAVGLAELDQRIAEAQAARTAIVHALACPHQDILTCPNFASVIAARLGGSPLQEAHIH